MFVESLIIVWSRATITLIIFLITKTTKDSNGSIFCDIEPFTIYFILGTALGIIETLIYQKIYDRTYKETYGREIGPEDYHFINVSQDPRHSVAFHVDTYMYIPFYILVWYIYMIESKRVSKPRSRISLFYHTIRGYSLFKRCIRYHPICKNICVICNTIKKIYY